MLSTWKVALIMGVSGIASVTNGSRVSGSCLRMAPIPVTLSGYAYRESKFGPPSFGEDSIHDARLITEILRLDHKTSVCANVMGGARFPRQSVREVELDFNQRETIASMLRSRITVRGTLSRGLTASDFRPVRILVTQLTAPDDSGRSVIIYEDTIATSHRRH